MINDFFPFTFKSNVFQKVGERKRMNTGGEEERGQRCKSEKKKKKRKTTCERKGKKTISQYETELPRIVFLLI